MSEGKVRVIIKRPDEEFGRVTNISPSLENLHRNVGGFIEIVTLAVFDWGSICIICDEEGRLKNKEYNCEVCGIDFVGDIIVAQYAPQGEDGEQELVDLSISFDVWKEIILQKGDF